MESICQGNISSENELNESYEYEKQLQLWHSRLMNRRLSSVDLHVSEKRFMETIHEVNEEETNVSTMDIDHKERDKAINHPYITKRIRRKCLKELSSMSIKEVAKKYSISASAIYQWNKHGIKGVRNNACRRKLTKDTASKLLQWYNDQPKHSVTFKDFKKEVKKNVDKKSIPSDYYIKKFIKVNQAITLKTK